MKYKYCICKRSFTEIINFEKDEIYKYFVNENYIKPFYVIYDKTEKYNILSNVIFKNNFIIIDNRKLILYKNNLWESKDIVENELFEQILKLENGI